MAKQPIVCELPTLNGTTPSAKVRGFAWPAAEHRPQKSQGTATISSDRTQGWHRNHNLEFHGIGEVVVPAASHSLGRLRVATLLGYACIQFDQRLPRGMPCVLLL